MNRREMIRVGALGSALSLSQYLGLRAADGEQKPMRSAIFIFMEGAPSHQDTFDLKPEAPVEVRGEFNRLRPALVGWKSVSICPGLPGGWIAER